MRRLVLLLSVVCSGIVAFVAPAPVHATSRSAEPIAHIWLDQISGPPGFPAPNNVLPWGLDRLDSRTGLDNKYSYTSGDLGDGTDVKVYVVDTGVKSNHAAFTGRVAPGWSYRAVSPAKSLQWQNDLGSCKFSDEYYEYDPLNHPYDVDAFDFTYSEFDVGGSDNNGHGTHVAGTVGGVPTGVAKGATIVPVRVLNSCGAGTAEMVRLGLEWILASHVPGDPAVVNMSIGFDEIDSSIDGAIGDLIDVGIPVVVAAGNSAQTSCFSTPAGTNGTITVGATTYDDLESEYSNFGDCVDIFAPGSEILSSWPMYRPTSSSVVDGDSYLTEWGTSMASPHVAGAVARYLEAGTTSPSTPDLVRSWLRLNATCNAISYYDVVARVNQPKTPNRLLAVGAPVVAPCAPPSLSATVAGQSVTAEWDPVAADNGSAVLEYVAELFRIDQAVPVQVGGDCIKTPLETLSCTFNGLITNIAYRVSVHAVNMIGQTGETSIRAASPPRLVTNLATVTDENSLVVSWNRASGEDLDTSYTAVATPGGASCTTVTDSCSIGGLTVDGEYVISVKGTNAIGVGAAKTLNIKFTRPPLAVTSLNAVANDNEVMLSWERGIGDLSGTSYTATASPGNFTCLSSATSCSIGSLTNGIEYSFSVFGTNAYGVGKSVTVKATPDGDPDTPTGVKATVSKKTATVSWSAVTGTAGVTYVVTGPSGNTVCATELTICVVAGLAYGKNYVFSVFALSATGRSSDGSASNPVRPGFKVKKTVVKKSTATQLTSLMTSLSKGKRTWSESGRCSIRGTTLVAAKKATTCVVTLKVAKTRSYPAMSTRLKVTVK